MSGSVQLVRALNVSDQETGVALQMTDQTAESGAVDAADGAAGGKRAAIIMNFVSCT